MSGKNRSASLHQLSVAQDGSSGPGSADAGVARLRTGSLDRLPSLRPKRDLTLGGVPKRTFTPTIPPRRNKPTTSSPSPATPNASEEGGGKGRGSEPRRGKGRGRGGRGRGRGERGGRKERNVVTSASVFSMGPAEKAMQRRKEVETFGDIGHSERTHRKKTYDGSGGVGVKDTDKHPHQFSDDEEESMEVVGDDEPFPTSQLPPVRLPLDYSLHSRHRAVLPKQIKVNEKTKTSDSTDSPPKLIKPVLRPAAQAKPQRITAAQLFTPSEGSKGQFLFLQLPDCLPVVVPEREEPMETEGASSSSSGRGGGGGGGGQKRDEGKNVVHNPPSLRDLPEGPIGKIQVHKSGKVKLVLGENTLDVAMGTPCGFLQELVTVHPDQTPPEMTVIGRLSHRLICTPDLEAMLAASNSSEQHR